MPLTLDWAVDVELMCLTRASDELTELDAPTVPMTRLTIEAELMTLDCPVTVADRECAVRSDTVTVDAAVMVDAIELKPTIDRVQLTAHCPTIVPERYLVNVREALDAL